MPWRLACLLGALAAVACATTGGDDDDAGSDDAADDDATDDDNDSVDDDNDAVDDDDDSGDDDDDSGDDDDDNDSADDDNDDDDNDDDDDDDDDDVAAWGSVVAGEGMSSSNYTPLDYYCYASASFYDPDDYEGFGDPLEESGDCQVYDYNGGQTASGFLNAGVITITGADVGTFHLNPVSGTYGWYYQADIDFLAVNDLFDPGDNIGAHVAGGGGIAATDLDAEAPPLISLSQPGNFDSLNGLPGGDLTFAWNAGAATTANVQISTYVGAHGRIILCDAPDAQGEIVVDSSLTALLLGGWDSLSFYVGKSQIVAGGGDKPVQLVLTTYRQRSVIDVERR